VIRFGNPGDATDVQVGRTCPSCKGTGRRPPWNDHGPGGGGGPVDEGGPCARCGGHGVLPVVLPARVP
jgi:hypothetical protein